MDLRRTPSVSGLIMLERDTLGICIEHFPTIEQERLLRAIQNGQSRGSGDMWS